MDDALLDLNRTPTLASIVATDPMVSSRSRWSDGIWYIDGFTPGQHASASALSWPEGHDDLLIDQFKLVAALLFVEHDGDLIYKHTTTTTVSTGLRHMIRFMTAHCYTSFAQLDQTAFKTFVRELPNKLADPAAADFDDATEVDPDDDAREIAAAFATDEDRVKRSTARPATEDDDAEAAAKSSNEDDDAEAAAKSSNEDDDAEAAAKSSNEDDGLTYAAAYYRLRTWRLLRELRPRLERAGTSGLLFDPFADKTLKKHVEEASSIAIQLIPPLPDEVALAIMANVNGMIMTPADDVIELQRRCLGVMARLDREPPTYERVQLRNIVEGFRFTEIDGRPWHPPIVLPPHQSGGRSALRALVFLIRDAAIQVIFSSIGCRISELCSLRIGSGRPELPLFTRMDDRAALPDCVSAAVSKTGFHEHLFLHGLLSKNEKKPKPEKWLMGSRPLGSQTEPPALRAIRVLEKLFEPWRELIGDDDLRGQLFLTFRGQGMPASPRGVAAYTSSYMRYGIRNYLAERIDWTAIAAASPNNRKLDPYVRSAGNCIRPHQWRKTFALYMMRIDERMIPALARHFKHMTIAVTENNYMPTDPSMIAASDSVVMQETVRYFHDRRHRAGSSFGRLDDILAEHHAEIEKLVGDLPFEDAFPEIEKFCIDRDIRIFHAEHGRCLIGVNPDQANCHAAAGTATWRNTRPNHLSRTPTLCVGCTNFSAGPESAGFWRRRYADNQRAWLEATDKRAFRVMRARADQSRAVLKAMNVPIPVILTKDALAPKRIRKILPTPPRHGRPS